MSEERNIKHAVELVEAHVEKMYDLKFAGLPKPPAKDPFKASAMSEIARRVRARAFKIDEDWSHFTRD